MATTPRRLTRRTIDYPTSDGKPMAETETHRDDMMDLIQTLKAHFTTDPGMYVTGNLLLYYVEGDKHKHLSPDVFAVRGVPKRDDAPRDYYLLWEEGKGPEVVIELTSKSTRSEDTKKKKALYRDVLRVSEYFLFDPMQDYLKPPMQGYRLRAGEYEAIEPVADRLPSAVLGLHLERDGKELRLFDPTTGRRLPTVLERADAERHRADAEQHRADVERRRADVERRRADAAEAEADRFRQELEALKRRLSERE